MNRRAVFLVVISLCSLIVPIANANAPTKIDVSKKRIEVYGVAVPEGYWVYGSIQLSSFMLGNEEEIVVEVTLLNSTGGVIDTVTTMVRPTILAHGKTGGFIAKSTTQEEVAEIEYRVVSSVITENVNFKYLEMSKIWTVDRGVSGWLENIHDEYPVTGAEVIATFIDVEGTPVDVQSYIMNYGNDFNPGEKKQWFCETDEEFDSYFLNVQCNLASRERYQFLNIERPNNVNNTWTPPIGETIHLYLRDQPHQGRGYVDVTITNPLGNSTVARFNHSRMEEYRYELTPDIPGVWNITWAVEPFWVESGVWAEGTETTHGIFTWDPNPVEANATETGEELPTDLTPLNITNPSITPPVDAGSTTEKPSSSASEIIDSATTKAEEIVESLPEEVKQRIPGFPVMSIMAAFSAVYILFTRKN